MGAPGWGRPTMDSISVLWAFLPSMKGHVPPLTLREENRKCFKRPDAQPSKKQSRLLLLRCPQLTAEKRGLLLRTRLCPETTRYYCNVGTISRTSEPSSRMHKLQPPPSPASKWCPVAGAQNPHQSETGWDVIALNLQSSTQGYSTYQWLPE